MVYGGSWSPLVIRTRAPSDSRNRVPLKKSMHCDRQGYSELARHMPSFRQWNLSGGSGRVRHFPTFAARIRPASGNEDMEYPERRRRHLLRARKQRRRYLTNPDRDRPILVGKCAPHASLAQFGSGRTGDDAIPLEARIADGPGSPQTSEVSWGTMARPMCDVRRSKGDLPPILRAARHARPRQGRCRSAEFAHCG